MSDADHSQKALFDFKPSDRAQKHLDAGEVRFGTRVCLDARQVDNATEFFYSLLDGVDHRNLSKPLRTWRERILKRAIEARERKESWTGHYASLGAESTEMLEAAWQRFRGVLHVCLVTTAHVDTCSMIGKPLECDDYVDLLPHMQTSFEDVKLAAESDISMPSGTWRESLLNFPYGGMQARRPQDKRPCIQVRILARSVLLDGTSPQTLLKDLAQARQGMNAGGIGDGAHFWLVLDTPETGQIPGSEALLTYVYQQIGASDGEHIAPTQFQPNRQFTCGVFGLEGAVFMRKLGGVTKKSLELGGSDRFWGGSVWLAWILTLYQHTACLSLAMDTAALGAVLTGKKGKDELDEPDELLALKKYWQKVIDLESSWMYQEISQSTDVDRIYRDLQKTFDIEEMWKDVREQTELIAHYTESERTKKVSAIQTIAGVVVGTLVLLSGLFGVNLFEYSQFEKAYGQLNLLYLIPLIRDLSLELLMITIAWWIYQTSANGRVALVRREVRGWIAILLACVIVFATFFLVPGEVFDKNPQKPSTEIPAPSPMNGSATPNLSIPKVHDRNPQAQHRREDSDAPKKSIARSSGQSSQPR